MEIIVTMERMLKAKPESKWYFFRGVMGGDGVSESTIICKGCMGWEPQEMETLSLSGSFVEYKGERQFQFKHAKLALPLDQRGMLHYVCQRTNGIGPATEEQIWNMYGDGWRHLQMGEIRKMSPITYANFQEEIEKFDNNKEHAEVISWLEDHGCSNAMAEAAYDRWKNEAPGIVTANCYRLAELPGFSFRTVDENVRGFFCIADDDPRRLKSGIEYAMLQEMEDGSTSVDCWRHLTACQKLLSNIGDDLLIRNVKEMKETGEIYIFPNQNMMSLKKDYAHEKMVFDWVRTVKTGEPEQIEIPDEVLFSGEKFVPDETQIEAVKFAISHKGAVINGGAGVGKTTVIKMIVAGLNLAFPELTVHLCAPTGKAAARLKEASGIHATTIHVLLGAHGNDVFTAGTLDRAAVIVDESSMVDSALMAEILKRRPARLILVGDQAQLTPVGHGQPFHDIIETAPDMHLELAEVIAVPESKTFSLDLTKFAPENWDGNVFLSLGVSRVLPNRTITVKILDFNKKDANDFLEPNLPLVAGKRVVPKPLTSKRLKTKPASLKEINPEEWKSWAVMDRLQLLGTRQDVVLYGKTKAFLAHDYEYLYLGAIASEPGRPPIINSTSEVVRNERIEFMIQRPDNKVYQVLADPNGNVSLYIGGMQADPSDIIAKGKIVPGVGYMVFIAIPVDALKFNMQRTPVIVKANVCRVRMGQAPELTAWAPLRERFSEVSNYGTWILHYE